MQPLNISHGEGPHWDSCTESLYFVDVFGKNFTIFRYDLNENKFYGAQIVGEKSSVSFIIPIKGCKDQFAVGLKRGVKVISWDGKSNTSKVIRTVFDTGRCNTCPTNQMNDAKADPKGRFYGGTIQLNLCNFAVSANSTFYRYTKQKGLEQILYQVRVSNGIAFNERKKKCYYVDSCAFDIKIFNWNRKTGALRKYYNLSELLWLYLFSNKVFIV